uniref:ABC transporter G family member 24 n=1 Tax=Erigeron canadensis TaxID=72917 RepID=UPI001CB8DD9B|nr:ABC transporter G family member 24 [Erigeron canadensis]XP_043632246.1 ABC transporter G family member 24 [Erigeron canadensis]
MKLITAAVIVIVTAIVVHSPEVKGQVIGDEFAGQINDTAFLPFVTQTVYASLSNLTSTILNSDIGNRSSFCVKNREVEWDRAFNFSSNLDFLSACITKTNGDVTRRVCNSAELKFYFGGFFSGATYLKPNRNCNLTSRVSGCEPGWACATSRTDNVDMRDSKHIPARTEDCQPCCEGFFCPSGLTCMIPCPLGSHCPTATLDRASGICKPYSYQLPAAMPNHTCGGANIWADVRTSGELFCSPGSYCPTSTQQIPCSEGNYCQQGSTSEKSCFKLTSCERNSSTQNIHAYGAMLIAAIITILLIIYNCSDQIITTRERRHAKSREAAARRAKEKVKAHERWKMAREAAKRHAAQISRTFSRKKAAPQTEELSMLHTDNGQITSDMSLPSYQENRLELRSQTFKGIDEDLYNYDLSMEKKDAKNHKKKMHKEKEKEIHTHSQIFNYAYGQIEKEKAMQQNQNLTFSGVISMAVNTEKRKRPKIEISFRDLTLTLKGKGKHLLRCVTGKIMPGRITAVMGPSGAGKTTFLSALAGKAHGCRITGSIFVNGKSDSIHSYKKIIGFVPQDDIVHGNLTVEENLWFSAKCRLPANMLKQDRVLVVERVIESLGLQAVRNSLVGTVEKRGISGGQRKRVNVGLEMVMEPSLLILDEPTSGLDSSSSQLLLRALRRETLEGVNVSMVVHQPSYSLFQMFDDLIILAKGGLTVYHGSVRKVEEYFSGLGINVPERVNPPDYFIDVLEGMVKPNTSSGVNYEQLPVRWMLHKGYTVPPDMRRNASAAGLTNFPEGQISGNDLHAHEGAAEEHSFAGEIWQDVRSNVEVRRDIICHNFLRTKDLSNRQTPGILLQYRYFLGRLAKQRLRESKLQLVDYLILLLAGACLGSIIKSSEETFGAPGYTYSIIAVSLLCKVAALRTFSLDKLQYWRERASGISSLAHFLAKDTVDHFSTVIKPAVYLSMFYFFSYPRSSFAENYTVMLCLVYCVTGIAYMLAIFLDPGPSQLFAVLLPVVLTLISTQTQNSEFLRNLSKLCYPKWALEAFVIANANRYSGVWLITRCGALLRFGYNVHDWGLCIFVLMMIGIVCRIFAFFGMHIVHKR